MNTLEYFREEHKLLLEESPDKIPADCCEWINTMSHEDIASTYVNFIFNEEANREDIKKFTSFIRKELSCKQTKGF